MNYSRAQLSLAVCPFSFHQYVSWYSSVWGGVMSHQEEPPPSLGDRAKKDGVTGLHQGRHCSKQSIGQNAISSLYRTLMALGMDGQISGRQKVHEGLRFPPVWIFVNVCGGVAAGEGGGEGAMCRIAHVLAQLGWEGLLVTDFPPGRHIILA